jgi:threonine dehydrogenase-like Zn-dependent dehydrogenase
MAGSACTVSGTADLATSPTREQSPHGGTWGSGDAPSESLQWAVEAVAKAGSIGMYRPQITSFPTGAAMNKNLTVKMGNCSHRRYMSSALDAYELLDERQTGWTKVALAPS